MRKAALGRVSQHWRKNAGAKSAGRLSSESAALESGDVHVITKGGKGPGDPTSLGLAPKYVEWINARLQSRSAPLDKNKGAVSSAKKGAVPHREKCARKYESKRKQAAAASAVAGPPPPLLPEPNPADIAKFQAEFERVKGRPLLGAK